jgi:biotin carboxylase
MSHRKPRIVIVDGYSTGRELVRELAARNVDCVHLRSTADVPEPAARSFDIGPYAIDLGHFEDMCAALAAVEAVEPQAVVAGSEWGVTLAEWLADGLGLPTNRMPLASARRDKFAMIEAVRRTGLLVAQQAALSSVEEARDWVRRRDQWPIVVKPLSSAGSDGVSVCACMGDVERAFAGAMNRRNFMGLCNERLLLQSYLSGPQFIVNTVSRDGLHYVSDAWYMTVGTPWSPTAMRELHLLEPSLALAQALFDYTKTAITALGIENGAAHSELRWTPNGPALVETNARIMGAAMDPVPYRAAGLPTQASCFAEAITSPAQFESTLARGHYEFRQHLTKVFFLFEHAGEIGGVGGLDRLSALPSFHAHYRALRPGDRVWRTSDTLARGGTVYLVHAERPRILADLERIRAWEKQGALYAVRTASEAAA